MLFRSRTSSKGCLTCSSEYSKWHNEDNREKITEYRKNWSASKKEHLRAYNRKYRGLPDPTRPYPTDGLCEGCGCEVSMGSWNLDHDHETGLFRGWLCKNCNLAEGNIKSSCRNIMKLHDYMMRFKSEQLLKSQIATMVF